MKKFIVLVGILAVSAVSFAAENWSNAERLQNRDAMVTGVVKSISKFAELASGEEVFVAEISVEKVVKANALLKEKTVQAFYLDNKSKDHTFAGYVDLFAGQRADFYLDDRPFFHDKDVFFIDENADVQKPNSLKEKS